jgi:hypothetical protein
MAGAIIEAKRRSENRKVYGANRILPKTLLFNVRNVLHFLLIALHKS